MPRTSLVTLAIVLMLTALPFTAAAKQQPWESEPRPAPAALPAPSLPVPPDGTRLGSMGAITLQWDLPAGSTQYQLQVIPANGDGPGVNLIRNAESQFVIPAPPTWYVILPGMTYTWRVRVTDARGSVSEGDPSWGPWSPSWRFTTPQPSADTLSPTQPPLGTTATSQNPTLVWTDANPGIFYYEIQLSSDPLFNTDPFTSTAAVYWNLIHGGETSPQNSWAVPLSARLDTGTRYYWRVRPRVQGNGTPVNWGLPFWFQTIGPDSLPTADLSVTTLDTSTASVSPGGQVQVQYTVKNLGVGASIPAEVHAVLSPDINITRLKQDLGPINTVGALASQQSTSQLATVMIPANQPVGSYFLGVYVDWTNQNKEAESGKAGNNGLGKLLTVVVTPTPVPGVTPPPPTWTPTVTNTPTPTATNTPSPTATLTPTPSPTPTNTPTPTSTSTPAPLPTFPPGTGPELVTNGNFESPDIGGTNVTYATGQIIGGAWTVESGTVDHVGTFWQAAAGRHSIDLNGNGQGTIYQDVTTTPGQSYRLKFAMAGNPDINQPPFAKQVQVRWGATLIDTATFDVSGKNNGSMGWQNREYILRATSAVTRLQFASTTGGTAGPTLDDISLR